MIHFKNLTLFLLLLIPLRLNAAPTLEFVGEFGGKGEQEGQFAKTVFVAFGPDNAIYVTDTDNFRIQKFSNTGAFSFDIQMEDPGVFRFINPTAIAVGEDSAIYVMDWMLMHISETENPKIFNYGPCVHKFDAQGTFVASYPLEVLNQRLKSLEAAALGLDAEGNYAIIIPSGDTKRRFLLSVDTEGNLYVCDNGFIYKLDRNGNPISRYSIAQPGAGQVISPAAMTVDSAGNLYIVDEKGHRVLKFGPDGTFERAFGEYGDADGQFIAPFHIAALADGTLLVADKAKYQKDFVSTLPQRLDNPKRFLTAGVATGKSLLPAEGRTFRYRLRRIQKFTTAGDFAEKLLVPFQREREADTALVLKGIDKKGALHYFNRDERTFRKYARRTTLMPALFQTELKLRYTRDLQDVEIDNQDDLDADLYTKADFDQEIIRDMAHAKLTVAYDLNEALRLALSNRLAYVRMSDTNYYRSQDFEDFRGTFNQDDRATEASWDNRIQLDLIWVRNHNMYRYREARAFAYFSAIRLDFRNAALDSRNFRVFDFGADLSDWGGGIHYDLSRTLRLNFEITHFFGTNNYTYLDETNVLYATGFQEANTTRAVLFINGFF